MRQFLILFSCLLLLGCTTKNDIPPNILFLMVDDLGKEWVSAYGAEDIQTPHIDQLAAEGIRFENVYCMPQCTPTRVTLLTGQYPFRHGWVNHWDVPRWGGGAHFDPRVNPSLGLYMKEAGYKTAIAGKWQINDFRVEPDAMTKHGFDDYCMWTGYETGIPASAERYYNPYIFTKSGSKTYEEAFGPDVFVNFLIDFIFANADTSWFVYFPMVLTHGPLVDTPIEMADNNLGKHKAMVRYTDKITGQLIQALEATDQRDKTLFIWTTDNGTARGIQGTRLGQQVNGGKAKYTENGICVPFMVSAPGLIESGQVSDALIDFTDMLPTFLDIANQGMPDQYTFDGQSFKSALYNSLPDESRDWIMAMGGGNFARLTHKGVQNQYRYRDRVIRNKRYKLYVGSDGLPEAFFDLQENPLESGSSLFDSSKDIDSIKLAYPDFKLLLEAASSFPTQDNDPQYIPNPKQFWDVSIREFEKL